MNIYSTVGMESGRRYIRIFAICAQLCNIFVFTYGSLDSIENVALGKPATQSSTYVGRAVYGDSENFHYSASLAVDGNNSTNFSSDSCSSTDAGHNLAWWNVDLNGTYPITKVKIYQRSDHLKKLNAGSRIHGVTENNLYILLRTLTIFDSSLATIDLNSLYYRFKAIRIDNGKTESNNTDVFIGLCEVQAFADVDECRHGDSVCNNNGTCYNTPGSFNCKCYVGFTGNNCETDVDECKGPTNACSGHGTCSNNLGSFICHCRDGYTGHICNTVTLCVEISAPIHSMLQYGIGIEEMNRTYRSTVSMRCDKGYIAVGNTILRCSKHGEWDGSFGQCAVINCTKQLAKPDHMELIYTGGIEGIRTYNTVVTARCREGYNLTENSQFRCNEHGNWEGSSGLCKDVDECTEGDSVCNSNEYCINTQGTFSCRCKEGYTGKNCEIDLDECKKGDSVCNKNGDCINTQGSFVCICKEGFTGKNCETEIWPRSLFVSVVASASASVAVIVVITLLIIWSRGGFRFCCNGLGREPKEVDIVCPQTDMRMGPTSNNTIQSDDVYEEINDAHLDNMTELSEYLEPTVPGIERGNSEYYNCRNEYAKLHPHRNFGNEMYVAYFENTP
ncbi:hypothetical protein CHS0354_013091 [Potamilus streckersoni]|uniref:Uncharacterized protein n=1 Tax=Potamilus streckersoni TaxID=2493646 RepID=A0AAE0SFM4_9BIVA|nr:hypothetical protein CHS0354_013091 [Potamilus streckersoni]